VLLSIVLCVCGLFLFYHKVHKGLLQQLQFKINIIIFQKQKYIVNEKHNYLIINNLSHYQ